MTHPRCGFAAPPQGGRVPRLQADPRRLGRDEEWPHLAATRPAGPASGPAKPDPRWSLGWATWFTPRRLQDARRVGLAVATLLAGCASGPPPPDWQGNAKAALDRAVQAALVGDGRVEAQEFERARGELARTGRPDWMARAELMRCAAHVASLAFEPCAGFERWRRDAAPAELAYAQHLAGQRLPREDIARLPPAQQAAAAAIASGAAAATAVRGIDDPQSRLIAAALLFRAGNASPETIELATETASAQGWRRPLLAWLQVQALRAERAGAADDAQRLRRRIELVQGGP